MSSRTLIDVFNKWQAEGEPFALVTVTETAGSTYSKAGRHLLIKAGGEHAGLLSGGCLEGDLAEHAREVIATGRPKLVTYDMRDDADDLWGIGLGCNGMMRVLLQRIDEGTDWQPLNALADAMASDQIHTAALIIASEDDATLVGTCTIAAAGEAGTSGTWPAALTFAPPETLPALVHTDHLHGKTTVLYWALRPWTRLLLLGAGPDAVPVVQAAKMLGWEVTVADHRPHYIDSGGFEHADNIRLVNPVAMSGELQLERYNAIVVMSHHLETDRIYLQQLATQLLMPSSIQPPDYVGILGPAARKQKLLTDLGDDGKRLATHLRGPVGLNIGASNPETIALSLISEIQAVIHHGSGGSLSDPA